MTEKEKFIITMKNRTKQLAVDIIMFCNSLKSNRSSSVISYQLVKSATSTGANYRAACKSRSKNEFFSKISIVVEEGDETGYWLEVIKDSNLSNNNTELQRLLSEVIENHKIMSKARNTIYKKSQY